MPAKNCVWLSAAEDFKVAIYLTEKYGFYFSRFRAGRSGEG
jgi:hypothetical protein